jgi:hypothetical protein
MIVENPLSAFIIIEMHSPFKERKIKSKKFNPKWLLNPLYVLLSISGGILISLLAFKYGGVVSFMVSFYPLLMCLKLASLYIIDVEHKFWKIEYES